MSGQEKKHTLPYITIYLTTRETSNLTSVIAFCSVFAGLGFVFNLFLRPMKENQARMENRIGRIESKLDQLINASTK